MKQLVLAIIMAAFSSAAYADGFLCTSVDGELEVKVFNHTQPEEGTRKAAVMILANPKLTPGERSIAVFRDKSELLVNNGPTYIAYVDLEKGEFKRSQTSLLGLRLENIYSAILDVDFSYSRPVASGTKVSGEFIVVKMNGDKVYLDMDCLRYLKQPKVENLIKWHHM